MANAKQLDQSIGAASRLPRLDPMPVRGVRGSLRLLKNISPASAPETVE
jgi:hypothetical protein